MTYLPLYQGEHPEHLSNRGLEFEKFARAWEDNGTNSKFDFANAWLQRFKRVGHQKALIEACARQRDLVKAQGGVIVNLRNSSRFVTGTGLAHPKDNGFRWHTTLGVPYLPGSGLKGVLRTWLHEEGILHLLPFFGEENKASQICFFDVIPMNQPTLTVEIMTPHYDAYYQNKAIPGDWHSPIPITYLAVEKDCEWQTAILPASGERRVDDTILEQLKEQLKEALGWLGAGAKTATGFGRFEFMTISAVDNVGRDEVEEASPIDIDITKLEELYKEENVDKKAGGKLDNTLKALLEKAKKKRNGWSLEQKKKLAELGKDIVEQLEYQDVAKKEKLKNALSADSLRIPKDS